MTLESKLKRAETGLTSNLEARVQVLCARAKDLEEAGNFAEARNSLSEFWQRIGDRPQVEGLSALAQADLFLRAGALSGWIGSAQQVPGAQEVAKDLISEAARIFEQHQLRERVAEARVDLAICYWREGAFDEARVSLDDAFQQLGDLDSEQRLRALLSRAIVEKLCHQDEAALKTHREAAPLFQKSTNEALKGKFHNEYAAVLKNLGLSKNSDDFIDRALVEYAAASFYAEQSGNKRFLASVENNVGYLFLRLRRFNEAHQHLDRARALFSALKDKGLVAQVDDTRARVFLAQGNFTKAETLARGSVKALEEGDQLSLLAEALTTHGIALSRIGNWSRAQNSFERAIRTAHTAGDPESSGVAALSLVEELVNSNPVEDLVAYYRMAEAELADSQHPEIQNRLGKCARLLLARQPSFFEKKPEQAPPRANGNGSSHVDLISESAHPQNTTATLEEQVRHYESGLIKQALEASAGSVTRASRMLGLTHQGLAFILNGRHKDLLPARKPVKRRRRSIIRIH
jgi:tetratricopeptide (TPR) repeat protein